MVRICWGMTETYDDDDYGYLEVTFTTQVKLFRYEWDDPSGVLQIVGRASHYDAKARMSLDVGWVLAYRICEEDTEASHMSMIDECDAVSQSLFQIADALLTQDDEWKRRLSNRFDFAFSGLLVIATVEVEEPYRGHDVGLALVRRTMDIYGKGCGIIALEPFPLQYSNSGERRPPGFVAARRKLIKHWRRLGFELLPRTPYMVLNTAYLQPGWEEVGLIRDLEVM